MPVLEGFLAAEPVDAWELAVPAKMAFDVVIDNILETASVCIASSEAVEISWLESKQFWACQS